jgi:ABC-type xylose transport system substrate-binding protein
MGENSSKARENQPFAGPAKSVKQGAPGIIWRRARLLFIGAAAILGALLITGCGPTSSGASGAQQLMQEFPWLSSLGLSFIEGLLAQYGTNILALLAAAVAAL